MSGDDAASVSEARASTSSIISAHQSPSLIWFACVYPVVNVKNQPPELEAIVEVLEGILKELHKRDDLAESHTDLYIAPLDQNYGGVRHIQRLEENMVIHAADFYSTLCMNLPKIKELHIIAGESGAYLAMRVVNFFVKHGDRFQYDLNEFDHHWADFFASGETSREENDRSKLIGNIILVCPSLPSPRGIPKMLWNFIRPPFYDCKLLETTWNTVLVDLGQTTPYLQSVTVKGPKVTTVIKNRGMFQNILPPRSDGTPVKTAAGPVFGPHDPTTAPPSPNLSPSPSQIGPETDMHHSQLTYSDAD